MNPEIIIWLTIGIILILSELIIPGGVVIFLGFAALIIALIHQLGYSIGILDSIFIWLAISIFFVLVIRRLFVQFWPSDEKYEETDFNENAKDKLVPVLSEISDEHNKGRIQYAGTSWPAKSKSGTIPKDEYAKILYRDNVGWIVEPTGKKITEDLWEI